MSVKNDIIKRIMYHKDCMRDCEDHVMAVQETYEKDTRSGLDDFQLKDLLVWRKEEQAKALALRNFHHTEKNWLARLLENCD